jgi:hypothetical protein
VVELPFRGEWKCLRPPGHHPSALDFMMVGQDGRRYSGRTLLRNFLIGIPAKDFHCWGEPVLAPFDGVVVRVGEGVSDRAATSLVHTVRIWFTATYLFRPKIDGSEVDIRPNVGNYAMVRSDAGAVALLAHLRVGSVAVAAGQRVAAGQVIGGVGNTGNATAPHIHINLFDQADDLLQAQVVPFVFSRYQRWDGKAWEVVENDVPRKGEVVRPCE